MAPMTSGLGRGGGLEPLLCGVQAVACQSNYAERLLAIRRASHELWSMSWVVGPCMQGHRLRCRGLYSGPYCPTRVLAHTQLRRPVSFEARMPQMRELSYICGHLLVVLTAKICPIWVLQQSSVWGAPDLAVLGLEAASLRQSHVQC